MPYLGVSDLFSKEEIGRDSQAPSGRADDDDGRDLESVGREKDRAVSRTQCLPASFVFSEFLDHCKCSGICSVIVAEPPPLVFHRRVGELTSCVRIQFCMLQLG
eukprot:2082732-Amphidinium_carterae.1